MEAHAFSISFFTAHFKRHETKKFRASYFLPPPTVIWGIIGAIFGVKSDVERDQLYEFAKKNNLVVGAELHDLKGLATEKATLMRWSNKAKDYIRTVEDFEFLIEPHYIVGVYAKKELIEELKRRIEKKNFEFDIYGGITDCFLKDIKNEEKAEYKEETTLKGMVPVNMVKGWTPIEEEGRIIKVLYLNTFFYQGFKIMFEVEKPMKTVNGIAVWGVDDIKRFGK